MITQRGWTFNPDNPIWDQEIKAGERGADKGADGASLPVEPHHYMP